ncbi:hypothetical protein ACTFIW_007311, partial [Dictyostelium discoideum]
ISKLKH